MPHPLARLSLRILLILAAGAGSPLVAQPTLELVVGGLDQPLTVRHSGDGSGRLFVVERAGRIRVIENGALLPTPFLDIEALVDDSGGEQGLLGLDFHPDYSSNGWFYVNYTRDPPGVNKDRTVVARYAVSPNDPNVADPASAEALLEVEQDFANHNGGNILFGPDGYLYVGMGDGGSGGDPNDRAQDLTQLLGKILRIDVDATPPAEPNGLCGLEASYGIPAGNPYAGDDGACDEIWASGLRNPWRFSFDKVTGDLWIGDVGQNEVEEVDLQPAGVGGVNYGWDCYEGSATYESSGCGPAQDYELPVLEYTHTSGTACDGTAGFVCSVTGGYRYRGSVLGQLAGAYLYADYCSREICIAREEGGSGWSATFWTTAPGNVFSFGEDEAGELYVAAGSAIYRIVDPDAIRADDFEAGDLSRWTKRKP